jgi:excisionase family DNA binding protein
MSRTQAPTVKAAPAKRHTPLPADPLNPLAQALGKAVAAEVRHIERRSVPKRLKKGATAAGAAGIGAKELESHMTLLVAKVLGRSLSSPTAQGKALRMALIAKLANTEIEGSPVEQGNLAAPASDMLLTTALAAARLEVSRPYVSMLCDAGKLGEVILTEGGHRRIRSSAVDAYLTARTGQTEGAPSPRQAGVDAGLYDHPEGHFQNRVREAQAVKPAKVSTKNTPKPRS